MNPLNVLVRLLFDTDENDDDGDVDGGYENVSLFDCCSCLRCVR